MWLEVFGMPQGLEPVVTSPRTGEEPGWWPELKAGQKLWAALPALGGRGKPGLSPL